MIKNSDGSISCCRAPKLRGGCCVNCGTWEEDLEAEARLETMNKFKAAGYTKYPVPAFKGTHCTALWQKWVRGGGKKLYALNLYTWEIPNHGSGVEAEVRMYTQDHEFNLNLLFEEDPVRVEAFYADAYSRLGCIPDPHNNDAPDQVGTKCVQGLEKCLGPYVPSGKGFVCEDCAIYHDEHPRPDCPCDDCQKKG